MSEVRLIHWKDTELEERVAKLEKAGYAVKAWAKVDGPGFLKTLREAPPAAVVIDLSRIPSHGREVGVALRSSKGTRGIPLVFVEGQPEKVARVKEVLPDATFASWRGIKGALTRAIQRPPKDPVNPMDKMASYSKTPLPKKLGIQEGSAVALVGAPDDFAKTLGALPKGAVLKKGARGKTNLTLWFVTSKRALDQRVAKMVPRSEGGGLWIIWPKKASNLASDLTQPVVRKAGMDAGMVDFKICAVDETWSGLRFSRRDG